MSSNAAVLAGKRVLVTGGGGLHRLEACRPSRLGQMRRDPSRRQPAARAMADRGTLPLKAGRRSRDSRAATGIPREHPLEAGLRELVAWWREASFSATAEEWEAGDAGEDCSVSHRPSSYGSGSVRHRGGTAGASLWNSFQLDGRGIWNEKMGVYASHR